MDKEALDALTATICFGVGALAGFINYAQRFSGDNAPTWKWKTLTVKVGTGGFVGLLTWFLLADTDLRANKIHWLFFCVAIAGYGGAETIAFFTGVFQDVVRRATGTSTPPAPPPDGQNDGAKG